MEQLITGEAAYLLAPGSRGCRRGVEAVLATIGQRVTERFGCFFLIEIWSGALPDREDEQSDRPPQPTFRIVGSRAGELLSTTETLERALRQLSVARRPAHVSIDAAGKPRPANLAPLLPPSEREKMRVHYSLGIEVRPIYRGTEREERYPMIAWGLRRQFGRALRKASFTFARRFSAVSPQSYQSLGRRTFVKAVREADAQLAAISDAFDFLLSVSPTNTRQAWEVFRRARFDRPPELWYRPLTVDPDLMKRRLFQVPIERIEDPLLVELLRGKREVLERELTLLSDRGRRGFLYESLQLYGAPNAALVGLANELLAKARKGSRPREGSQVDTAGLVARVNEELDWYRASFIELDARVELRDDISGLMVSKNALLVDRRLRVPAWRVDALIQHEVGTHVLTYVNGRQQPFKQLYSGLAGYDELQEGLAVLAEYLVDGLGEARLRLLAGRVVAVQTLVDGASFVETFRELVDHGFAKRQAFQIATRVHRAGGLTKDVVYLRGLVSLLDYLGRGGQLEPLFVGKFNLDQVALINELQQRGVLRPAALTPRYLERPAARTRLDFIRKPGRSVLDLATQPAPDTHVTATSTTASVGVD
jgi:uncharacterized protein (TIGR02421 family)